MKAVIQQHITGKSKSKRNGVAEWEKGVNVVQLEDVNAEVLQRPITQEYV